MSDPLSRLLAALARQEWHDPRDGIVRIAVQLRAREACEYCLLPTGGQFQIDHIIPTGLWASYHAGIIPGTTPRRGRQGPDHLDNYAWCCPFCNSRKRKRITGRIGRQERALFGPRQDRWEDHFVLASRALFVVGLTERGQATEQVLGFNDARLDGPLAARHLAILEGRYPPIWASDYADPSPE